MGIVRSQGAAFGGEGPIIRIAIFASGAGSNAEQIILHLKNHPFIRVSLIVCNKPGAGVLQIAEKNGIETLLVEKERFFRRDAYTAVLIQKDIRFVVLAGFLWKIPPKLISTYPNRIINIHPALLPKYGGKGMFGSHVHEAVISNKDKSSGISVHYVDELYDHGSVIFQASCPVYESDDAVSLAQRIHALEHKYYPGVVERLATAIGA